MSEEVAQENNNQPNNQTNQKIQQGQQVPQEEANEKFEEELQQQNMQGNQTGKKKKQAQLFKKYLQQTGIAMAFQVIFAQILDKKIQEPKVYTYTAMRLRQIGEDLEKIKLSKK